MTDFKKLGRSNHRKGAHSERELRDLLNKAFKGHNFQRIAGVESNKWSLKGDVRCMLYKQDGTQGCTMGQDCEFQMLYIEVKNRKGALKDGSVSEAQWKQWFSKAFDDAGGDLPILFYREQGAKWFVVNLNRVTTFKKWVAEMTNI